jgi:hypothetical protein
MIETGLYYAPNSECYWRVYEVTTSHVTAIKMLSSEVVKFISIAKFEKGIEEGSLVLSKDRSALLKVHQNKKK